MKKTKYIFLILSILYIFIAIGKKWAIVSVNDNILLGLSLTSLLMSLGDAVNMYISLSSLSNTYNYSLLWLKGKIEQRIQNNTINTFTYDPYNMINSLEEMRTTRRTPPHPYLYGESKGMKFVQIVPTILFIAGVSCFMVIPFLNIVVQDSNASQYITIVAFAVMCFNIYLGEELSDLSRRNTVLLSDKLLVFEAAAQGIQAEYYQHMQHYVSYTKTEEAMKQIQEAADKAQKSIDPNSTQETK